MANNFVVKNGLIVGDNAEINGTGAIKVPVGSQAQRPIGEIGQIRFNASIQQFEGFNGSTWGTLADANGGSAIEAIASTVLTNDTNKLDKRKNLIDVENPRKAVNNILPSQINNTGKIIVTDGNNIRWAGVIEALPDIEGNDLKYIRLQDGELTWDVAKDLDAIDEFARTIAVLSV